MKKSFFSMFLVCLILIGCNKTDVTGDVYVVKGDGSVKPVAGRKVSLLPYSSTEELTNRFSTVLKGEIEVASNDYVDTTCGMLPAKLDELIAKNQASIEDIKNNEAIGEGGCDTFEQEFQFASGDLTEIATEHKEEKQALNKKISELQLKHNAMLKEKAGQLYQNELKKIKAKVWYESNGEEYQSYDFTVVNGSDYALQTEGCMSDHLYIRALAEGHVFYSTCEDLREFEDKYGVSYDALPAGQTHHGKIERWFFLNVTDKRFMDEKNLKTCSKTSSENFPCLDELILGEIKFVVPTKKESYGSYNYICVPVDWTAKAGQTKAVKNLVGQIKAVQTELGSKQKAYEVNPIVVRAIKAETQRDACIKDTEAMTNLKKQRSHLERLQQITTTCQQKEKQNLEIIKAVNDLNDKYKLSLPKFTLSNSLKILDVVVNSLSDEEGAFVTETNMQGGYQFKDVKKNNYMMVVEYEDSFNTGSWVLPVGTGNQTKIDLNQNSMQTGSVGTILGATALLKLGIL